MAEEEQQNTEATQAQEATPEVKEAPAAQDKPVEKKVDKEAEKTAPAPAVAPV